MAYQMFLKQQLPNFEAFLTNKIAEIQEPTLKSAAAYSLLAGGKRLRPGLLLAIMASFNRPISQTSYQIAGAIELIHTYSLIHDDLPAMDNDELRRGRPTSHIQFNEATAILAGDSLLTLAFEWLATTEIAADKKIALITTLAKASGPDGMIAGQMQDMAGQHQKISLAQLERLHQLKTGALITASLQMGAILVDMPLAKQSDLQLFSKYFGLAFQIQDDILDVVSTSDKLGKQVHKDQQANKNTYPGLLGLEPAKEKLEQTCLFASQALQHWPVEQSALLLSFLDYFKEN